MEKKTHILLVDDDEIIRRIFGFELANAGFEVIYAEDGNQGREMARRFQPNLILMDIHMPVMDGLKASSLMKSEKETKAIPIVLLTNSDLSIEAQKAVKELGINDVLHKGIDIKEFINTVKNIILNSI